MRSVGNSLLMRAKRTTGLWLIATMAAPAFGQISLDGTMGPSGPVAGPDYVIPESVGRVVDSSLFHSFGEFSIGRGESATFTGASSIQNVLSRVTGGSQSTIDGLLRSTMPNADFYFMNPAGVIFGPHMTLDVPGAFHVTTADYIRLADGTRFNAVPSPSDPLLSVAPPAAFGFLVDDPAPIRVQGSGSNTAAVNLGLVGLTTRPGKVLSLVGGDIEIADGDLLDSFRVESNLSAPDGTLNIASVSSTGEVVQESQTLDADSFVRYGSITVTGGSSVNASGEGGGHISIRGGTLFVDNAFLLVDASGDLERTTTAIDVEVDGDLILVNGSGILTRAFASGDPGGIALTADRLGATSGSLVGTVDLAAEGAVPGRIAVKARQLTLLDGGLGSVIQGPGNANEIAIDVDVLELISNGYIEGSTTGPGRAADIFVNASDNTFIDGFGAINAITRGDGNAGNILVNSPTIVIDEGGIEGGSFAQGSSGNVSVNAGILSILTDGDILTTSFGSGDAGNIEIVANDIAINGFFSDLSAVADGSGEAGDIEIRASTFSVDSALIDARSGTSGGTGTVRIEVDRFSLTGGAQVTIEARGSGDPGFINVIARESAFWGGREPSGQFLSGLIANAISDGHAGSVFVQTPELIMADGLIQTLTDGAGNAGSIDLDVGRLELRDGAQISARTFSSGQGGSIDVAASESILVTGSEPSGRFTSGFFVRTSDTGTGGQIRLSAPRLTVEDSADVSAASDGPARAGAIIIEAEELNLSGSGLISTNAFSSGAAGDINVIVDRVFLRSGAQISSSVEGSSGGGTVDIRASQLIDINGRSAGGVQSGFLSTAKGTGKGGTINLEASSLRVDAGGVVAVSADQLARAGNIDIDSEALVVTDGGIITSSTTGAGDGGNIEIQSASVMLDGRGNSQGTGIQADTEGDGKGGAIRIASNGLNIVDGATVSATTKAGGKGGTISIDTATLTIDGKSTGLPTGVTAAALENNVDMTLRAVVDITHTFDSDLVATLVSPSGTPVTLFDTIGGNGDNFRLTTFDDAAPVSIREAIAPFQGEFRPEQAFTTFDGESPAGVWTLILEDTFAADPGVLNVWALSVGPEIVISNDVPKGPFDFTSVSSTLSLETPFLIGSNVTLMPEGEAGSIQINVDGKMTMRNDGLITSETNGIGKAGDMSISVGGQLELTNGSVISSESTSSGDGGGISIAAKKGMTMRNGALVTAQSSEEGLAGDIVIDTGPFYRSDNSRLNTEASKSDGGNIEISARDLVFLRDSEITATVEGGEGKGGNITIDPVLVILINSRIIANAFGGPGGNILIVADNFLADELSVITASSARNLEGIVEIKAPDSVLNNSLLILPSDYVDAASRLAEQCSARKGGVRATLVGEGRGGVRPGPASPIGSTYLASSSEPHLAIKDGELVVTDDQPTNPTRFAPATLKLECAA